MPAARQGAYELGRGEARAGRSVDALLAAYRIGARVSWREMSATAVEEGVPAPVLARFAELVFAYIDELSGASLSGHADELAASGRVREQRLARLGQALADGAASAKLDELAEHAEWAPPETLTAVLLPVARVHDTVPHLDVRTLTVPGDAVELGVPRRPTSCCSPTRGGPAPRCCARLEGRGAVVGPARPWRRAVESLELALRAHRLLAPVGGEVVDTEQHRDALVVGPTSGRSTTCGRPCWPRSTTSSPPPPSGSPRPCRPGCCTSGAVARSPTPCTSTRRPSATGWTRSASCTATASRTPPSCSSSSSRSPSDRRPRRHHRPASERPLTVVRATLRDASDPGVGGGRGDARGARRARVRVRPGRPGGPHGPRRQPRSPTTRSSPGTRSASRTCTGRPTPTPPTGSPGPTPRTTSSRSSSPRWRPGARLATVEGREAAPIDYLVALLRVREVTEAGYPTLAPETRALLEGYAAGLNAYAAAHPDQVLSPELVPVTGEDLVAASVQKAPLFFGLEVTLAALFDPAPLEEQLQALARPTSLDSPTAAGSNVLVVGPSRTPDGATHLISNSHQPWTGPVAWYEATLTSDEGWRATGALFPGVPAIVLGHNEHVAWSFTVNRPDLIDVYRLDVDPDDPTRYRVDGEWLDMEVDEVDLEVRLLGRLRWTVQREVAWTIFGPVVRRDDGDVALRWAGMGNVGIFEQLHRFNRAGDLDEWRAALAGQDGLASFNAGVADASGRIGYLYHALLPDRRGLADVDWSGVVPGDTRETLWTDVLPFDELPWVEDPEAGFLQNANSTPFSATIGPEAPDAAAGPSGRRASSATRPTGRCGRSSSSAGRARSTSTTCSPSSSTPPTTPGPRWHGGATGWSPPRRSSTVSTNRPASRARGVGPRGGPRPHRRDADGAHRRRAVRRRAGGARPGQARGRRGGRRGRRRGAPRRLPGRGRLAGRRARRVEVPWGEVNRLRRGDVDLPLDGGPDLLRAIYGRRSDDGVLEGFAGDAYLAAISFAADGTVTSRAVHQFGSATLDEGSPHHADQAPDFAAARLRPVPFTDEELAAAAVVTYRAGEPRP
jgi:acyl-homoserine-lactone acylase